MSCPRIHSSRSRHFPNSLWSCLTSDLPLVPHWALVVHGQSPHLQPQVGPEGRCRALGHNCLAREPGPPTPLPHSYTPPPSPPHLPLPLPPCGASICQCHAALWAGGRHLWDACHLQDAHQLALGHWLRLVCGLSSMGLHGLGGAKDAQRWQQLVKSRGMAGHTCLLIPPLDSYSMSFLCKRTPFSPHSFLCSQIRCNFPDACNI